MGKQGKRKYVTATEKGSLGTWISMVYSERDTDCLKSTTTDISKSKYKNTLFTVQNTPSLLDAQSLKIPKEKEKESVRTACQEESVFTRL